MDFIKENKAAIAVIAVIAGLLVSGVVVNNKAADEAKKSETTQTTKKKTDTKKEDTKKSEDTAKKETPKNNQANPPAETEITKTTNDISFIVASGESYTTLARKAVQSTNKDLTKAQVIAAETFLTQGAGSPAVNAGATVVLDQAKVDNAIQKAQKLSKSELAAWEKYVPYVQF